MSSNAASKTFEAQGHQAVWASGPILDGRVVGDHMLEDEVSNPADGCNNRQPLGHETPCFKNTGLCDLGRRASLTGMQGQ